MRPFVFPLLPLLVSLWAFGAAPPRAAAHPGRAASPDRPSGDTALANDSAATSQPVPPAERPLAAHALYVELGGLGLAYTLNYEYRPARALSLRAAFAALPFCMFDSCGVLSIGGVSLQGFIGTGPHHVELGAGVMAGLIDDDDARFLAPSIGYRYQRRHGGVVLRVTFTPLFRMRDTRDVLPWGGLSAGFAF